MKRHLYPSNWRTIATMIKTFADWTCEKCGRPCRRPGESNEGLHDRLFKIKGERWCFDLYDVSYDEQGRRCTDAKFGRFTLTVAHLDQDPGNNNKENLMALCPTCHNRHDAKARAANRSHTRIVKIENAGQLRLPGL